MINIEFINIRGEGFQSIGTVDLNFNNLGTCFVKGVNNYDSKTKSNGSGKSSLFSMLSWVLFGKTPSGIGNDVVNKFLNNGCYVELTVKVDGVTYTIRRSLNHIKYKTNLILLKEQEDISGRIKTDTDKIIKEVLKINEDIFSQMIFLSQGFANRFAIYSPKFRKELLESIYNINSRLDLFINDLKMKESDLKNTLAKYNTDLNGAKLEIHIRECDGHDLENDISNLENKIKELKELEYDVSKEELDDLNSTLEKLNEQKENLSNKYTSHVSKIKECNIELNHLKSLVHTKMNEIIKFSNNKVCPTCGTVLENYESNEHILKHIAELNEEINNYNSKISLIKDNIKQLQQIESNMLNKLNSFNSNIIAIKNEIDEKSTLYAFNLEKHNNIDYLNKSIIEKTEKLKNIKQDLIDSNTKVVELSKLIDSENKKLEILQHSIKLGNNQFKSYLLENIINVLNDKLKELSHSLFENETIIISGDSKLDIYLGEKIYEQLSGGEQRKVDIAIILAQRYLAQKMNTISSNILIADEIFDGLDETSFMLILDLLSDEVSDVESTFIISHRDIKEIPLDHIITVTKEKNQVSTVEIN